MTLCVNDKQREDRRLDQIGWGLFLIMIGGLMYLQNIPPGTWLIGTGLIMVGINVARSLSGIPMRTGTLVLGVGAILIGLSNFIGIDLPWLPILLIFMGATLIFRPPRDEARRV